MNDSLAIRRLWWKELRQMTPLLLMLPAIAAGLQLLNWANNLDNSVQAFQTMQASLVFGMPALFACGVGAMLVGYEKELRTIAWLSSLPIPARRIVWVKLGAGLAGLVILWALSGIYILFAAARPSWSIGEWIREGWTYPTHSLYVLFAGFALAWRSRSALVALLLVVPAAIVPYVVATGIERYIVVPFEVPFERLLSGGQIVGHFPSPHPSGLNVFERLLFGCQIVGVGIAGWLSLRWGRVALSAEPPSHPGWKSWLADRDVEQARRQVTRVRPVRPPMSAAVWQFAAQSRAVLIGCGAMLVVAAMMFVAWRDDLSVAVAGLLAFVASSWLGVVVFQSDGAGERIRFLADRGLSPSMIWWSRQLAPAGLLAGLALLTALSMMIRPDVGWDDRIDVAYTFGAFAAAGVAVYLTSQWFGQLLRSPVVSAIGAPLVSVMMVSYAGFAIGMMETPWWLVALLVPLPAVATRRMTRRWMDRNLGLGYWAGHGGFLAAVLVIPAVPMLFAVARQPSMPSSIAAELDAAAEGAPAATGPLVDLVLDTAEHARRDPAFVFANPAREQDDAESDEPERDRDLLRDVESQLRNRSGPISTASRRVIEHLQVTASIARLSMPGDEQNSDEEIRERYRGAIRLLVEITDRMRTSPRIIEQDTADLIEIWLLEEVRAEGGAGRFGETLLRDTCRLLGDRTRRKQARTRAVALSWESFRSDLRRGIDPNDVGGYSLDHVRGDLGTLKGAWIAERKIGAALANLWELARGGPSAATPERLRQIASDWGRPEEEYGIGPGGIYFRADDPDRFVRADLTERFGAIASQWYAGWENVAAEVAREQQGSIR